MKTPHFDVVVVGAGHAGLESALASAKLGAKTLVLAINLDSVGYMACNPSIGGPGKAHMVCEIDALGGVMGVLADETALQIRMLNTAKGAAVHSLRAQSDKIMYQTQAKQMLETHPNITLKQGEVVDITTNPFTITLSTKETFTANAIVVATGTYMESKTFTGDHFADSGPNGFARSNHLAACLRRLGVKMRRFKTDTPPRLNAKTINYEKTIVHKGDDDIQSFSFLTTKKIKNHILCHMTYTNPESHKIIRNNLSRSPVYGGWRDAPPTPRYCPSIEDKIVRFPDRERHQVFLEPESLHSNEIYMQGMTTSMPADVQRDFVNSIEGLEKTQIVRNGYAIEYESIDSLQLDATLQLKAIPGLYFAGQVNGTSGYEEAAAQGLVAGINAASCSPFVLSRTQSYIGVLIDDLVTKGTNEPYRMMTSRAEHRLALRHDNADIRLTPLGRDIGLVCDKRWRIFQKRKKQIEQFKQSGDETAFPPHVVNHVNIERAYAGYIAKEQKQIDEARAKENTPLPLDLDYNAISNLGLEAREKLSLVRPNNIAQATRISGVSPADITVLLIWLRKNGGNK